MSRYICSTKLKHLIFINGGSMSDNIETIIYCLIDSFCIGICYMMIIYYVTPFVFLILNYLPHHIFYLGDMHVTTFVSPTMSSLSFGGRKYLTDCDLFYWPLGLNPTVCLYHLRLFIYPSSPSYLFRQLPRNKFPHEYVTQNMLEEQAYDFPFGNSPIERLCALFWCRGFDKISIHIKKLINKVYY
jgi:hypothetical protein